jgi:hypothetical protein
MAISASLLTNSFKKDMLTATQNFGTALSPYNGNTFYMALYPTASTINADTGAYTATGETSGTNYVAGGKALTVTQIPQFTAAVNGATVWMSFNDGTDVTWTSSTITAGGALIYNSTLVGKNSVCVLNFGGDKSSSNGTFAVQFPAGATASTGLIRIS